MKRILLTLAVVSFICCNPKTSAATMAIDSLSGAVTANEINSFKTYMATQAPQQTPWGTRSGTGHNAWADGTGGRELEAMGEMYEVTGDIAILTNMISFADTCVSERNDLMSSANGGQRVMWTGVIDKVWCPNDPTSANAKYAASENEDTEGHIAYCAKLILETPSIWNNTVPDGNPFGYGVTYLDRAKNYLAKCDEANDEYSLKWFIDPNTSLIVAPTNSTWTVFNENVTANNRQMMFTSGFQRLAEAHELLGDNPSRVAQYDAIVLATVNQDLTGMVNFDPYIAKGQPVYDWGYYPTKNAPESVEIHAEYDMIGVWRAYNRPSYGYTRSPLIPFANTMVDVIYLGTNTFGGNVDASGGTQSPIYSGWLLTADWNPQVYTTVAGSAYTNNWYKSSADIEAGILFMKNRRYQEFSVAANPGSQIVNAGSGTSYTVTLAPLGGFTGSVTMSASGLPTGATASFNHSPINLGALNVPVTNITMTVSTGTSTAAGSYTITVTGTSGSVSHSDTVTLVVADFSISATPSSRTVEASSNTTYTVNTGNNNGFSGNISLSASGLPSGASASFNPTSITAGNSSTMTVTTSNTTPAGSYTLTITGTSGSDAHSTTVTLNVTGFSVSATPPSQTITAGNSTNFTATIGAINGFDGNVAWSVSGLPSGASGNFSPAIITGSGSSTLTITTTNTMPASTNTLTVTGTSGSLVHSATVTLIINAAGGVTWATINDADSGITYSGSWTYSANRGLGDYNDDIHYTKTNGNYAQYTFTGTGVQYITETYSDESNVDVYIDGAYQTTVSCYSTTRQSQFVAYSRTGISSGSHTIKVVKNSGNYMLLDAFAFTTAPVPDFTISATPSSQTVVAGNGTTYTTTISATNGFSGSVSLSVSGLPSGASGNFSPATINGSGSSTLTITTSNSTSSGTNTLTITGTSGSLSHQANVTLIVTPSGTPGANLALNKTATASSIWSSSYTAAMAVDGSDSTRWSAASGQTNNQWVLIDLGADTSYNRVVLKEISFPRVTSFKIQSSNDATNFTDLFTGTTIGASNTVTFAQVTSRYVRLLMPTASGVPTINEIQVYQDAQLFQNTGYGGWFANFPLGTYTTAQMVAQGAVDNDTSSVRVPAGMKVTLYINDNFTGTNVVETADDPNLIDKGINDAVSSLKVETN